MDPTMAEGFQVCGLRCWGVGSENLGLLQAEWTLSLTHSSPVT